MFNGFDEHINEEYTGDALTSTINNLNQESGSLNENHW